MTRSVIAFVVAPLWVPVVVAPYAAVFVVPHPVQSQWVAILILTIFSVIPAYGVVLAFGLPGFLILRFYQLTNLWIFAVLGFVVGLAEGAAATRLPLTAAEIAWLLAPSLLGLAIGVTFWLIARPDRNITEGDSK